MIPRHLYIAISILLVAAIGMSVYVWRMRGRAAATPVVPAETGPVVTPFSGATERASLYVAYDDIGILRAQSAQIPLPGGRQQRAEEVLKALMALYLQKSSPHPIPAGSDVRSVLSFCLNWPLAC